LDLRWPNSKGKGGEGKARKGRGQREGRRGKRKGRKGRGREETILPPFLSHFKP